MALPPPVSGVAQAGAISSDSDAIKLRRSDGLVYEAMFSDLRTAAANGIDLSAAAVPSLRVLTETHAASTFTDGGAAVGTKQMTGSIPVGAILIGSKIVPTAGFAGDVSCTMIVGDGSDTDRYVTGTPNVFATAANGVESGVPSGAKLITTANQPTLTITSNADITPVIAGAGSATVSIFYLKTV